MPRVTIETTQNVALNYEVATVGDRALGWLVDSLIIWVYLIFMVTSFHLSSGGEVHYIVYVFVSLPAVFYSLVSEIFMNGRTVGKIAAKTKVIKLDGSRPGVGDYFLRWVFRIIDISPVGVICIVISDKGQRLGDIAAGTAVIKMRRRVFLSDTIFNQAPVEYIPVFEQVKNLNDADIAIIKNIYVTASKDRNFEIIQSLADKISEVINVHTPMPPIQFIMTVLKDYSEIREAGVI